jgi:hypothetical protein
MGPDGLCTPLYAVYRPQNVKSLTASETFALNHSALFDWMPLLYQPICSVKCPISCLVADQIKLYGQFGFYSYGLHCHPRRQSLRPV